MRARLLWSPLAPLVFVTLLNAPAHAAWPHDPSINLRVTSNAPNSTIGSTADCPDGNGGFFVAWEYYPLLGGSTQIFLQHITASGTYATGWPTNGIPVASNPAATQFSPSICPDGAGGVFVTWTDGRTGNSDIFIQRITSVATVASGWPAGGVEVSYDFHNEISSVVSADASGGAFVAWTLIYSGSDVDTYIAHTTGAGSVTSAVSVSNTFQSEHLLDMVTDRSGNGFVAYTFDSSATLASVRVMKYDTSLTPGWSGGFWQAYANPLDVNVTTARLCLDGAGDLLLAASGTLLSQKVLVYAAAHIGGTLPVRTWISTDNSDFFQLYGVTADPGGGWYLSYAHGFPLEDARVIRIRGDGQVAYPWPSTSPQGFALDDGTGTGASYPFVCGDGVNGALVSFVAANTTFGTRLEEDESFAPGWARAHTVLSDAAQPALRDIVTDTQGGGYAIWLDSRDAPFQASEVFAQHVDRFGALGDASPYIASIKDVPGDQGGAVKLVWNASYLDSASTRQVNAYWIWREVPTAMAEAAVTRGASWANEGLQPQHGAVAGRLFRRASASSATGYAWEYVASQPANIALQYSYVASTLADSMPGQNKYTRFMVEARAADGLAFWDAAPDSGYSVDNLPPATPSPFNAQYHSGVTALSWGPNHESDLAGYKLYRGSSSSFTPGPSTLLSTLTNLDYDDVAPAGSWYKLAAYDIHGNVSGYAVLGPSGIVGVEGVALPTQLAFSMMSASPARGTVSMRLALPQPAETRLDVFDAVGRRVRTLTDAALGAGYHDLTWDTRGDDGHALSSGLYFARLTTSGRVFEQRIVLLH